MSHEAAERIAEVLEPDADEAGQHPAPCGKPFRCVVCGSAGTVACPNRRDSYTELANHVAGLLTDLIPDFGTPLYRLAVLLYGADSPETRNAVQLKGALVACEAIATAIAAHDAAELADEEQEANVSIEVFGGTLDELLSTDFEELARKHNLPPKVAEALRRATKETAERLAKPADSTPDAPPASDDSLTAEAGDMAQEHPASAEPAAAPAE